MKRIPALLLLIALLLTSAAGAEIYLNRQPPEEWADRPVMRLTTFPTPTNDAALLEAGGLSMLIDGGVRDWAQDVRASLTAMGYGDGVDVIYNTHPHDDHLGCQVALLTEGFRAEAFWSTFPPDYDEPAQRLAVAALEAAGIPYRQLENGEELDWGGAHLVFWYFPDGRDPNALSSMMHVTFGNATLLMTADASTGAQDYFHRTLGTAMRAQVMKFPHHGYTVARSGFLDDVDPQFSYIPSRQRMTRSANSQLRSRGVPFLHTSIGPLTMVTDGEDWYIWQVNAPY